MAATPYINKKIAHIVVQKNISVFLPAKFNMKLAPTTAIQLTPITRAVMLFALNPVLVDSNIVVE
jgi:hypothetical protein